MTQTHSATDVSTGEADVRSSSVTYPFSIEQSFLRGQHESDGSSAGFGLRPISSGAWRVRGPLDRVRLQHALNAVVARHEALRVEILKTDSDWGHHVRPTLVLEPTYTDISVADSARDDTVEEFVISCESEPFPESSPSMLRAHVGLLGPDDFVLVLIGFLPVVDVWSIGLVLRDILTAYEADSDLTPAVPYREYVAAHVPASDADLTWWREQLTGYRPWALTSDRPPAEHPSGTTRVDRFHFDTDLTAAVSDTARRGRATPYIVLLTMHLLQLAAITGRSRGMVWMLTAGPGRRSDKWQDVVGYFPNMCPLPVDLTGCRTFNEALTRVRASALASFQHELPFVQLATGAAEQIAQLEQPGLVVPGFAMFQNPADLQWHETAGLTIEPVRRRHDQDAGPGIPDDAILWTIGLDDELSYALSSSVDRYDRSTMRELVDNFIGGARTLLASPNDPLDPWSPTTAGDHPDGTVK